MPRKTPTPATAADVRAWAKRPADQRGRLPKATVQAYLKAHPGTEYVGATSESTVTVPVVGVDSAGRKRTRKVTLTVTEAREALGQEPGQRGRIPLGDLADVLSQREADKVADTFTRAA